MQTEAETLSESVPPPATTEPGATPSAPAVSSAEQAEGTPAPRGVVSTAPVATPVPESTPQTVQSAQGAGAPDDLFAQSPNALAGLASYRYVTVFSFTDEVEGKPESGSIEMSGAFAGPDRRMAAWKDLGSGEEFSVIRVGDEAWMREGDKWTPIPAMVADAMTQVVLMFAPATSWGELAGGVGTTATYVGTETVNGIRARHYASTYRDWVENEDVKVEDASGDVWIAEAGYPVRYRFTAKGVDEKGYKGTALWSMDLFDVNSDVRIEAPQVVEDSGE